MHDRKVIGILATPAINDNGYIVTAIIDAYRKAIVSHGCIPLLITPLKDIDYLDLKDEEIPELTIMEKNMYLKLLNMCDGLIIPGGGRIYNYIYYVIEEALKKDMPILGTCMGMQALAIIDNNYTKCISKNETDINHCMRNTKYVHKITIEKNTKLYDIIGKQEVEVNSCHNYHIDKVNNFIISSYSEDGIIESIELPNKKFVVGVQWHPEKMYDYDLDQDKLIMAFVEACYSKEYISL